ncbi:unnamed protein product, partial [Scytosiphon promiscuus]
GSIGVPPRPSPSSAKPKARVNIDHDHHDAGGSERLSGPVPPSAKNGVNNSGDGDSDGDHRQPSGLSSQSRPRPGPGAGARAGGSGRVDGGNNGSANRNVNVNGYGNHDGNGNHNGNEIRSGSYADRNAVYSRGARREGGVGIDRNNDCRRGGGRGGVFAPPAPGRWASGELPGDTGRHRAGTTWRSSGSSVVGNEPRGADDVRWRHDLYAENIQKYRLSLIEILRQNGPNLAMPFMSLRKILPLPNVGMKMKELFDRRLVEGVRSYSYKGAIFFKLCDGWEDGSHGPRDGAGD